MSFKPILIVAALAAGTTCAHGDTTIRTANQYGDSSSEDVIQIAGGMMRVDSGNAAGFMLFDRSTRTITMVRHEERSYTKMDEETLRSMGGAVQQAMQQLEAQLANLPPAQREQMRRMMEERMGAMMGNQGGSGKTEIIHIGESRTVAGYQCDVVRIMSGGSNAGSACMTGFDDLDVAGDDRQTIEAMADFGSTLAEQFGDMMPAHLTAMAAEGYPVEYESSVNGTPIKGSLQSVESGAIDPARFRVPDGYREQAMPTMPGG